MEAEGRLLAIVGIACMTAQQFVQPRKAGAAAGGYNEKQAEP